jgi:predicted DNA-binding transcriptional regulator AlpA
MTNHPLTPNRLLNEQEAADILGCSPALLRKMRLTRTIGPAYCKIGRLVRYAASELDAFIVASRVEVSHE